MSEDNQNNNKNLSEKDFQKILKNLVEKDVQKNSKKLWIGEIFVQKSYLVILLWLVIFGLSLFLSLHYDTFELAEQNRREYLIWSHDRVKAMDMQKQMQEDFQKGLGEVQIPERSQQEDDWSSNIIVSSDNGNLFTKEGIKVFYEFENAITKHEDYKDVCLASVQSPECSNDALLSLSKVIYQILNKAPDQLTDEDVENFGNAIFANEALFTKIKFFFDNTFSKDNRVTHNLRSYMRFGAPLKIDGKLKKDKFDDRSSQRDKLNDFQEKILDIRDENDVVIPDNFSVEYYTYSDRMAAIEFQDTINRDTYWAIASVSFVLIYISCHLKSLFLGSVVMGQILISFPLTQCIFNLILGITFFSSLHVCAIFIVLGISADNVFVFVDCWEQTALYDQLDSEPLKRLNQRMAITYRRASRAMLATSSTTSAAFLATGFSNIMPISSFGIFAGILIPVNFFLVILFFPAILIVYENYMKDNKLCCCMKKNNPSKVDRSEEDIEQQQQHEGQDLNEDKLPFIEKFFATTFTNFTNKFKFPILLIFLIWLIVSTIISSKISPLSKPEELLADDHKAMIAKNKALYDFHPSASGDTGIVVYQFWGVEDIDASDNSMWDVDALGINQYDDSFKLAPKKNQQFLYDYCTMLKDHKLVQDKRVDSFIFDFKTFAETETPERVFPVEENKFLEYLKLFIKSVNGSKHFNQNRIGLIKDELKYIQIKTSSIGIPFKPYDVLNPLFEDWDELVTEYNDKAPEGLRNSKQTAGINWTWMITERAFVSNALQGMGISLAFGLVVLMITTHNIIISLFSLLSILGIVISVISVIQMCGWELGIAESITIVIVIGLSIDYVVHLANHYVESVYPDRHRKIKVSLRDLGISILSGALTTAGSGFFLFFADMIIFNKFATLILSTVFFSLAFSLLFFSSLMHAFGPENETGSILKLCKIFKKPETEEEKQAQQSEPQQNEQQQQQVVIEQEKGQDSQNQNDSALVLQEADGKVGVEQAEAPSASQKMEQYQEPS